MSRTETSAVLTADMSLANNNAKEDGASTIEFTGHICLLD